MITYFAMDLNELIFQHNKFIWVDKITGVFFMNQKID